MITSSISQAERMLTEFDGTCGYIGLQLNLHKTVFKRNLWVSDALFTLNGTNISECTSYVYLSRELNMMNDLTAEPAIREETSGLGSIQKPPGCSEEDQAALCSPLQHHRTSCFDLCFRNPGISQAGRKRWASLNAQLRVMHGVSRFTQVRDGIRRSLLRQRSKIRDAAAFAKESKIRWAGHLMRFNDNRWTRAVSDWATRDIKRTTGRPPA
ncbi:hypothetical protein RB195_009117 [Necator americanus]|uniref:Reverse transcriptase domain-containing protein n=1 Tax=Necator americanus TaxID=51031 RepID=A0ABR1CRU6_NECAM